MKRLTRKKYRKNKLNAAQQILGARAPTEIECNNFMICCEEGTDTPCEICNKNTVKEW